MCRAKSPQIESELINAHQKQLWKGIIIYFFGFRIIARRCAIDAALLSTHVTEKYAMIRGVRRQNAIIANYAQKFSLTAFGSWQLWNQLRIVELLIEEVQYAGQWTVIDQ